MYRARSACAAGPKHADGRRDRLSVLATVQQQAAMLVQVRVWKAHSRGETVCAIGRQQRYWVS